MFPNRDIELLPEEPPNEFELKLRKFLALAYRFAFGVFFSVHTFDFLFNPIWMHGYLWSLNQPIDIDLSDKSAGVIVEHQLEKCGKVERFIVGVLSVLAVIWVLRLAGYHQNNQSVWKLFYLSALLGTVAGTVRCMQQAHRLYSVFHEAFYVYFHFFVVGLCMTLRPYERWPKPGPKKPNNDSLETDQDKIKKNS